MNESKIRDPRSWVKWNTAGAVGRIIKLAADYDANNQKVLTVLTNEITNEVIDEAIGNWTQQHFKKPDPRVKAVLLRYATVITRKVFAGATPYPDFAPGWKVDMANQVAKILDYKQFEKEQISVIADALLPIFGDKRDDLENGLWGYSIAKIASIVGCVAYMVKIDLEPKLLEGTPEEINTALLKMAENLARAHPEKVLTFDSSIDEPHEVINEIRLRVNPPDISGMFPKM